MPVSRSGEAPPDWCRWSAFGFYTCEDADAVEEHFHDAHEYWLICEGRVLIRTEGQEYEVGPGDVVFTKAGDTHDVVKVLEGPARWFWIEDELHGRRRPGHLHRGEDD